MRINEILVESSQLDELGLSDVGRGIGKAVGKTAYAAGGLVGGARGAMSAAKAGYDAGKSYVSGQTTGSSYPKGAGAAQPSNSGEEVSITGPISRMSDQELSTLKTEIDSVLTSRTKGGASASQPQTSRTAQAGAAAPQVSGAGASQAGAAANKPVRGQMATVNGKDYMFAGNMWVDERNNPAKGEDLRQIKDMFAKGEIGPPPAERPRPGSSGGTPATSQQANTPVPSAQEILKSLSKLKPDQVEVIRDMLTAKIQGQQNVAEGIGSAIKAGWNKVMGRGGLSFDAIKQAIEQMTPEQAKGLLSQLPAPAASSGQGLPGLTAPTLQPKDQGYVTTKMGGAGTAGSVTTGGVRPAQAGAAQPAAKAPAAAQPATAPNQYGQLTPDEQKFVAAREREGLEPDQIQAALANRRTRQKKPAGAPKAGPKTYLPPEKSQAKRTTDYDWYGAGGVNPSTKLSDLGPVGAAAKRTAANEGFYSRFLGKEI